MPWMIPYAIMGVVALGSYWYASSLDYPDYSNLSTGSTVAPADTGSAFAAFPQYPSSEWPVPVIYGKARLSAQVVHFRPYGDNFEKCHYIAIFGDKGYTINQMYVDDYRIEDLPNYWENILGAHQDETNTWSNAYPLGGSVQIPLNNSGTFGVMKSVSTVDTITSTQPAIFYGGGSIICRSTHVWTTIGSKQKWQWTLTNLDNITEIKQSQVYSETFNESQEIDGGDKADDETVWLPGTVLRSHEFVIPEPLSKWSVSLEVIELENGEEGAQIVFYNFEIVDISFIEEHQFNATMAHVHLVRDASVTTAQPVINAEAQKSDNGNPAESLYEYLSDTAIGLGLKNVDYASASTMASWCDANDYYFNRAITAFYDDSAILKEMCTCGRIILYEENGQIKMIPDQKELVTYPVDDTEIIPGSLKIIKKSKTSANRIEGQYTEPFYGYTLERIYAEDHEDIAKTGRREVTLGLAGVTSQLQAHNLTHLALNYITESQYNCSFDTGVETAAMFKVGKVIEISSENNVLINDKKWRVQKIEEKELFVYSISCDQYKDEIYDFPPFSPWYEDVTELGPIYGWPGPEEGAATVINIEFDDISFPVGCSLATDIVMKWVNPTERFDFAEIYWSHNKTWWYFVESTTGTNCSFTWPMRYGKIYIKIISHYTTSNRVRYSNSDTAPIVAQYITGDPLCLGEDYPGYGRGQWGMQPWGG